MKHRTPSEINPSPNAAQLDNAVADSLYENLMKELLVTKKIKINSGVVINTKAIQYFRGQDFVKWVLKHQDFLIQKYSDCIPTFHKDEKLTEKDAAALANELLNRNFIYKAHYVPYFGASESDVSEQKTVKWPKKLEYSENQLFDKSSFYVLLYEIPDNWRYVILALIIISVLAICMFPAWPLKMKLMIWYFVVALSTFLLILIVLRLVVFILLWFGGFDFWILPNFFAEDLGVIDSFFPLYSSETRQDGLLMYFCRAFLALLISVAVYQLRQTHSIKDVHNFAKRQFLDVVDWGVQKLSIDPSDSSRFETLRESDPYDCFKKCGFDSFQELKKECMDDCSCLKALIDSHCYPKCVESVKTLLHNTKSEICAMVIHDAEST